MKDNVLAIGVSHRDHFSIMMAYYPKDIHENFDIILFVDNRNDILQDIKDLIDHYNIPSFKNAKIVINTEMMDEYSSKFIFSERVNKFLFKFFLGFRLLVPIYLREHFNTKKTFAIDDDIFILRDLSPLFNKYQGWVFKKENLFDFKNKNKHRVLKEFNSVFNSDFTLSQMNSLSLNSGTIIYDNYDDKYPEYVKKFIENDYIQSMFFDHTGYSAWTVEQRFQHFNMHRLMKERNDTKLFEGKEVRLITSLGKEREGDKFIKIVVPYLIHYTVGVKKPLWLRKFIPGIAWRFNDYQFTPKFELKDILYNKHWEPTPFKLIHKKKKEKVKSLF